jgi:type II secretory pathway pseudopilin PulG
MRQRRAFLSKLFAVNEEDYLSDPQYDPPPPKTSSLRPLFLVGVLAALCLGGLGLVTFFRQAMNPASRQEAMAQAALQQIAQAQSAFRTQDPDKNGVTDYWVRDVAELAKHGLIDQPTADADGANPGRVHRMGYYFAAVPRYEDASGEEKSYDDGTGRNPRRFGLCGYPAGYPDSGRETYLIGEDGVCWGKDTRGRRVTLFPADPKAAGWRRLD